MSVATRLNRELKAQLVQRLELLSSDLYKFVPRTDCPEEYDQQSSALYSKAKVTFIRGGNGSGKTELAAQKVVRFITQVQAPPRPDTPFVVISDTYEQVANICWKEKLYRLIPAWAIDDRPGRCRWNNKGANWPYSISLKPWPCTNNNWVLEFHSLDQGRRSFQGRSFGGFWFSEQFEWDVFDEVIARCRDTWYDGAGVAEFTPLDPDLAIGYEEKMADPPQGWVEYRLNMFKNPYTSDQWKESFIESVSEELRETRKTGEMLSLAGAIYKNFNPAVHVLDDHQWKEITGKYPPERGCSLEEFKRHTPQNVYFRRATDWGESPEHPFVFEWGWKDGSGTWFIWDEYVDATGMILYEDRRTEIKNRYPWPDTDPHFGMNYADPSRPLMIAEFSADGITTVPASNNVQDGIEYVRKLIQLNKITKRPKLYILKKNCPTLIKQLRKYRWMRSQKPGAFMDRRTNPTAARMEPLKYQDDCCDCTRYLTFSDRVRDGHAPTSFSPPMESGRIGLHLQGRFDKR